MVGTRLVSVVLGVLIGVSGNATSKEQDIATLIFIDGEMVASGFTRDGATYAPVRLVAENLGCEVARKQDGVHISRAADATVGLGSDWRKRYPTAPALEGVNFLPLSENSVIFKGALPNWAPSKTQILREISPIWEATELNDKAQGSGRTGSMDISFLGSWQDGTFTGYVRLSVIELLITPTGKKVAAQCFESGTVLNNWSSAELGPVLTELIVDLKKSWSADNR